VGALAHYLEQEGVPTTQISLLPEHTRTIRPPRALYVPFEFGRPLGPPDDPDGQRQVMLAALRLLERTDAPVLVEYAPASPPARANADASTTALDGLACMLPSQTEARELKQAVRTEIGRLRPLYEAVVAERGRPPAGVLGWSAEELAEFVLSFLDGAGRDSPHPEMPRSYALKLAVDDLIAFYNVSVSRNVGAESAPLAAWFWHKTALGKAIQAVRNRLLANDDPVHKAVAYLLVIPIFQAEQRPEVAGFVESYGRLAPSEAVPSRSAKRG
jgi:hypothetical protein